MYLFFTRQIFQSRLKVEGNKSSSTFCDKSGNTVLLAILNLYIMLYLNSYILF